MEDRAAYGPPDPMEEKLKIAVEFLEFVKDFDGVSVERGVEIGVRAREVLKEIERVDTRARMMARRRAVMEQSACCLEPVEVDLELIAAESIAAKRDGGESAS